MPVNDLSAFLYDIMKQKLSINPWAPLTKHIYGSRLPQVNLDELHLRAVRKTASGHKFMTLFPGPVFVLDEEGGFVLTSDTALTWIGKDFEEIEGEFVGDFIFDRRRKNNKTRFLSPIIEAIVKDKSCIGEKCYVTTNLLSNPIAVEISTKKIIYKGNSCTGVVIVNERSAGNFDCEIMKMYTEMFADSPEILTYFSKYIADMDVYTRGHCMQVTEYALRLGIYLGLEDKEIEQLYVASLLHDIGKLAVSPEILHKKEKLTAKETAELQVHPVAGYDILQEFMIFNDVADVVRHHHENFDGTGYPDKLKGNEIPLLSRILSLADALDIITNGQKEGENISLNAVKNFILQNSGKKFAPELVQVALKLIDNGKLTFSKYCNLSEIE